MDDDRSASPDPIAVVGIGCRFPGGVVDAAGFWRLLTEGVDAIDEIPSSRIDLQRFFDPRPAVPGRMMTRWGGFLDRLEEFDPAFFGISPREAERIDPQQRLLLETAWEALEDAGVDVDRLEGSATGVFVGQWLSDFEARLFADPEGVDFYMTTGSGRYATSGRLSYLLGLRGPSLTLDTACSSSLAAVHLAVRSLRSGESTLALAGGVNVILQPHISVAYSQSRMMAPDGRCKFGDARADGYVRSEGAGIVALKPLARARADGDRIYALIRGSALNNDGRSSGSMGTPSQTGQQELLRAAYRDAAISPGRVSYIEAHGTGTRAGDPVELGALGRVLADDRQHGSQAWVGSVKTNIGHTESAAGIAGLIKVALALHHGAVPPSLHQREPNPAIPWSELPLAIPSILQPWRDGPLRRVAGVSAFGIAGTNAHVVLESAGAAGPLQAGADSRTAASPVLLGAVRDTARVLPLSARSEEALAALAARYADRLMAGAAPGAEDGGFDALCFGAATRRTHHTHRAVFRADDRAGMIEALRKLAGGEAAAIQGVSATRPRIAFLFPGQGGQWLGMGRQLMARVPAFRKALEDCDNAARRHADFSIIGQLMALPDEPDGRQDDIDVVQPLLAAVEIAYAQMWRSLGVEPDAVIGHSMGEVAAAFIAGVLSIDQAMQVICRRSALMRRASGRGAMALVGLSIDQTAERLKGAGDTLGVAVDNGPGSSVVSGDPEAVGRFIERVGRDGVFARLIKVDVASHSPQMEPQSVELTAELQGLRPSASRVPIYSTVFGERAEGERFDARYWGWNLRRTVLFGKAVGALLADGATVFVEMGPHPVLLAAVQKTAGAAGLSVSTIATAGRDEDEIDMVLTGIAQAHVSGVPIDWSRVLPAGPTVDLPLTPWVRERHWVGAADPSGSRSAAYAWSADRPVSGHPFLDAVFEPASGGVRYWGATIAPSRMPFLLDHRVGDSVVFPAAGFCELMLAAARAERADVVWTLSDVRFPNALVLNAEHEVQLQVEIDWTSETSGWIEVRGRIASGDQWTLHCAGRAGANAGAVNGDSGDRWPVVETSPEVGLIIADAAYALLEGAGIEYGAGFRGLVSLKAVDDRRAEATLAIDASAVDAQASRYFAYPAMLDASLQALLAWMLSKRPGVEEIVVPTAIGDLTVFDRLPVDGMLTARLLLAAAGPGGEEERDVGQVTILDSEGRCLMTASDVRFGRVRRVSARSVDSLLQIPCWLPLDRAGAVQTAASTVSPVSVVLVGRDSAVIRLIQAAFASRRVGVSFVDTSEAGALEPLLRQACDQIGHRADVRISVVDASALCAPEPGTPDDWLEDDYARPCEAVVRLARALDELALPGSPRVWLLTRRAAMVGEAQSEVELGQAALSGLGRVMANEYPKFAVTMVDLDTVDAAEVGALVDRIVDPTIDRRLSIRQGRSFTLGLSPTVASKNDAGAAAAIESYRAVPGGTASPADLRWQTATRSRPEAAQVEIEVAAAGLNFMNLLAAMDALPGYEGGRGALGIECAGRVVRVGEGVERIRVGDEVVAVAPHCMARHVIADEALVHLRPPGIDPHEAGGLPIAFLTAYYSLCHLARLAKGERVLIHSALGGVGLAAIQIAQDRGAEVLATAGTEEKRERLRAMGVRHVFDSRSLAFTGQVLAATSGHGVDVVLNSLAGPAVGAGVQCLAPYGRFVELGKRDIYGDGSLALQPFRRNLSFFAVDLDLMMRERPRVLGEMLGELMAGFAGGRWRALPVRLFEADRMPDAFTELMPGTHVGKHVVSLARAPLVVERSPGHHAVVRRDGSYVVTGGNGALGMAVARWLADRGAGCVMLIGRSAPLPDTDERILRIERRGTRVMRVAADVACETALSAALDRLRAEGPPIRGVFHAAGVLADAPLARLTPELLLEPARAKALGAVLLDRLTAADSLDHFMMFSSVASLFGTPGQGNYAAANAVLDALAHQRRSRGRPALSVNLGPVAAVGLAAADGTRGAALRRLGFDGLDVGQVIEAIDRLLAGNEPQAACMAFDVARWRAALGKEVWAGSGVPEAGDDEAGETAMASFADRLRASPPGLPRRTLLEATLREEVAEVLRLSAGRVPVDRPLKALGLDSLMALELRNRLERRCGLTLSPTLAWSHPTIALLGRHLAQRLGIGLDIDQPAGATARAEGVSDEGGDDAALTALLDEVESLSDEDARRLLEGGDGG